MARVFAKFVSFFACYDPRCNFLYLKFYMPNQWRGRAVRGECRVYPLSGGWQGDHTASQNQRVFFSLVAHAVYRNAKAVGSFTIKNRRHALYKVPCVGTLRHVPLHTSDVVPRGGSVEPGKPPICNTFVHWATQWQIQVSCM